MSCALATAPCCCASRLACPADGVHLRARRRALRAACAGTGVRSPRRPCRVRQTSSKARQAGPELAGLAWQTWFGRPGMAGLAAPWKSRQGAFQAEAGSRRSARLDQAASPMNLGMNLGMNLRVYLTWTGHRSSWGCEAVLAGSSRPPCRGRAGEKAGFAPGQKAYPPRRGPECRGAGTQRGQNAEGPDSGGQAAWVPGASFAGALKSLSGTSRMPALPLARSGAACRSGRPPLHGPGGLESQARTAKRRETLLLFSRVQDIFSCSRELVPDCSCAGCRRDGASQARAR